MSLRLLFWLSILGIVVLVGTSVFWWRLGFRAVAIFECTLALTLAAGAWKCRQIDRYIRADQCACKGTKRCPFCEDAP